MNGPVNQAAFRIGTADAPSVKRAQQIVMNILVRAANAGLPCPSNGEISGAIGANSVATAARWINKLEKQGVITVERGTASRVVTIADTGKKTAGHIVKPHWRLESDAKSQIAAQAARETLARNRGSAVYVEPAKVRELLRVSRDPCFKCGVRSDIGCQHMGTV